jgi:zinc protease
MLGRIGADQVQAWARTVHAVRPVAVVVGDLTPPSVLEALGTLTSGDALHDAPWSEPAKPVWQAGARSEERRKQQSALTLAFPAPPSTSSDRYAVRVIGALLSGMAGRLFDELRERRSLAYTVAALPWAAREAGAMLCYIATSPEREAEAREAMLAELRRLSDDPPTEAELTRARNYTAGTVEIGKQSGRSLAATILEAWRRGSIEDWAEAPARLRRVELDDVLRVAAEIFQRDRVAEYVVRGNGLVGR